METKARLWIQPAPFCLVISLHESNITIRVRSWYSIFESHLTIARPKFYRYKFTVNPREKKKSPNRENPPSQTPQYKDKIQPVPAHLSSLSASLPHMFTPTSPLPPIIPFSSPPLRPPRAPPSSPTPSRTRLLPFYPASATLLTYHSTLLA